MNTAQYAEVSLEFNRHVVNLLDSLSALSELAALSIHDFDETQLLKQALEALMANQDLERCSIFLLDDENAMVNVAGLDWPAMLADLRGDGRTDMPVQHKQTRYRIGEGIMGQAAQNGEIQHCRSCADNPQFSAYGQTGRPVDGSLICVPIACETRVLGVLNVFYPEPDFFNTWHERLLLLFCQLLGRLLLNHRLTFHLNSQLDARTRETQAANTALQVEVLQRRIAMEQLDEQRQFLQNVIDSIVDPIMVIGTDYRLLMANTAALAAASAPSAPDRGLTCHLISHGSETPCSGENHQCPLRVVQETGDSVNLVHVHRGAKGEPRQIELRASPLHDRSGMLIGIVESARDVTEQRLNGAIDAMLHRLDLMLIKWRMDMKTIAQMFCDEIIPLFDLVAAWIGQAESDGSLSFVAAAEAEDVQLLDVLHRHCRRWDDGEDSCCQPAGRVIREGLMQKIAPANLKYSDSSDAAFDIPRAVLMLPLVLHGRTWGVLALYARNAELFDQADIPPRLVSVASRLCVSIEASLQQEMLTLLDTAVSCTGNAVFITDAAGRIKWANRAFLQLSGYTLEEMTGKTPTLFKSGAHDADFYRRFWETIQSGTTWHGALINQRRDGSRYAANQTVTTLRDANGDIGHYVSVLEDAGDRRPASADFHP